jgi:hypothetical protein
MDDVFDLAVELEKVIEKEMAAIRMKEVPEIARQGCGDTPELPQENKANTPKLDDGREETIDDLGAVEPVDMFGDTILTGKPKWPDDACPAPIYNFARDESERIGVDIEMIAFPAITCAAIAISDKFKIQPKQHDTRWTESARLWAMVVSESGQKKTPCFKAAFEPLKKIEKNFYFQHQEEMAEYSRLKQLYDREKKAADKNGDRPPEKPEKPIQMRYLADDITVEALRRVLEHNDNGIGVIKDELSGWINSFDVYRSSKQGGKDRADYCELFQGGNKTFDRAEQGCIFVPNWSASIMGFIQPGPVKRNFGNITDDGMLARFLVCHGQRQGRGVDRKPDYTVINTYHGLIKQLSQLQPKDGESEIFKFSPESLRYREAIYTTCEHVQVLPNSSDALIAHLSKWEAAFCRIALVYHIVESVSAGQYPQPYVPEHTSKMAATLMVNFLLPNSTRFYNDTIDDGENGSHARWIAGYILSNRLETIGSRDIQINYRLLRNKRKEIARTMDTLCLAGWITPGKTKRDGNVTKWDVNPKVHTVFARRAKEETARRADEREKIQRAVKIFQTKREGE